MKRNKFNLYGNKILLSILIKYLFFHSAIRQNMLISHTRKSCLNIHILRVILSLRILENILIAFRERNHPTVSSRSRWIVSYPSLPFFIRDFTHNKNRNLARNRKREGKGLVKTRSFVQRTNLADPSGLAPDDETAACNRVAINFSALALRE